MTDNIEYDFATLMTTRFKELEAEFARVSRRLTLLEREYRGMEKRAPKKQKVQPAERQPQRIYSQPQPSPAI